MLVDPMRLDAGLDYAFDEVLEALTREIVTGDKRPLELQVQRMMRRMFSEQRRAVIDKLMPEAKRQMLFGEAAFSLEGGVVRLREERMSGDLSRLLEALLRANEDLWSEQMAKQLVDALAKGADTQAEDLGIRDSFELPTDRVEQRMRERAGERIRGINDGTRDAIRDVLERGARDRKSYTEVARELQSHGFSRDRAELIAITEIGQAYSDGQREVGQSLVDAGIPMEKAWLPVAPCPICAANAAQGWIPFSQAFQSGQAAPLAHPRCKCALQMRRAA